MLQEFFFFWLLVSKKFQKFPSRLFPETFFGKSLESWQSYIMKEISSCDFITCLDLAKGKIRDKKTQARLFAYDCFFIAGTHMEGNNDTTLYDGPGVDYAIAIEWAEAALE